MRGEHKRRRENKKNRETGNKTKSRKYQRKKNKEEITKTPVSPQKVASFSSPPPFYFLLHSIPVSQKKKY